MIKISKQLKRNYYLKAKRSKIERAESKKIQNLNSFNKFIDFNKIIFDCLRNITPIILGLKITILMKSQQHEFFGFVSGKYWWLLAVVMFVLFGVNFISTMLSLLNFLKLHGIQKNRKYYFSFILLFYVLSFLLIYYLISILLIGAVKLETSGKERLT